ncbi:uncharacterized protein LOC127795615 [Diospyros lotus]|uniref:uncharacterized protein LOC127795615 n=1 Tax=Diospyros lotus TaxID=55363 RepID=UPI0022520459|nr:uncharacterized protein LOC127795615 [Diospyros lotus]
MDLSEEWKSLWPISSVFSAPLLLSSGGSTRGGGNSSSLKSKLGPLIFNPSLETLELLFSSPSFSPPIPPPFPRLSLSRFLSTPPSSLIPSIASSIAATIGPQISSDHFAVFRHNRLQLLNWPATNSVIAFFPTGDNSDQIGFVEVSFLQDSKLNVRAKGRDGQIFTSDRQFNHRIERLLVNPLPYFSNSSVAGYLLACTMYSVHWFSVRIGELGVDTGKATLGFLGSKVFKSSVVYACWSQHLPEESLVLMESGEMFLFDVDCCSNGSFSGKKLRVPWEDYASLGDGQWLSCEFSWHPRVLIVCHSSAVFLVDLRREGCNVSCLLQIDALGMNAPVQKDQFVAFSKADSDDFCFVVATRRLLLVFDVRKPLVPLLQWAHDLSSPSYVSAFPLSDLRSHCKDDRFNWASDSGHCIILGSFWHSEFSIFCYGPALGGTVASEISRFGKSFYAWELPSELSLSGRECHCGSCLLREEFSKDALPEWIDWQQKKEIVLGFGILDKDLHAKLSEPDEFGGFTLIRLMSSGKLEIEKYCASWEFMKVLKEGHKESSLPEDTLLYAMGDGGYNFPKRFKYLKLDYLYAYTKGNLDKLLFTKAKKHIRGQFMASGFSSLRSYPAVLDVLKDIRLLSSMHEVALKKIYAGLPANLLQLTFCCYSELDEVLVDDKKVSLEFLDVPSQPQLPPFVFRKPSSRSSKWTHKVGPGAALVGPVLPTPVLLCLHKLHNEEGDVLSANAELRNQCNEVIRVASEMSLTGAATIDHNDHAVSLADDTDEMPYSTADKPTLFCLHKPAAFANELSTVGLVAESFVGDHERFTTFISKTPERELVPNSEMEMAGPELFKSLSPVELRFDERAMPFGPNELKAFKLLRRQYSNFLHNFSAYQECLDSSNFQRQYL